MLFLILLFYLTQTTLSRTITPISTLFSPSFEDPSKFSDNSPSPLPLAFSRDVSHSSTQRSVWDIISSCLATLFACSWVSVHPDVPSPEEKWWRNCVRRIEYMLWALLTPEMIIWWAARQWIGARSIERDQKAHGWTVTHGHFMQMGGFMLFEGKERKGTLSYHHFCALLNKGRIQIPDITQKEIEDKSKSDALSKSLVVAQTGWFVMQCIVRVIQGLPITELELSTLASAVLNGFMYFFWWNKRFGVHCPYPVHLIPTNIPEVGIPEPVSSYDEEIFSTFRTQSPMEDGRGKIPALDQNCSSILDWGRFFAWPLTKLVSFIGKRMGAMTGDKYSIQTFDACNNAEDDAKPGPMHVPKFYSLFLDETQTKVLRLMPIITSLYGIIHSAGWDSHFPTTAELWLWRLSSLIIAVIPVLFFVIGAMLLPLEKYCSDFDSIAFPICFLQFVLYALARLVIQGEVISTLRDPPPGASDVVEWTSFLPHV